VDNNGQQIAVHNSLKGWILGLAATVIAGLVGGWFTNLHSAIRDHDQRLPVLESKMTDVRHQLDKIDRKLDKVLEHQANK
jgi:hypothetical protein